MRIFNFEKEYSKLLTPDIVSYLVQIHEYKGAYANGKIQDELLSELVEIARIQSTEASNRIESVSYTHLTLPTNWLLCRSRWSPYH